MMHAMCDVFVVSMRRIDHDQETKRYLEERITETMFNRFGGH